MVAVESVEERTSTDGPLAWKWIDGSGHVASWATVLQDIRSTSVARKEVEVHIGCDSAVRPGGQEVIFAVAVCIISVGHAGRYFYSRQKEALRLYPVLQTRLLREVELSLNTADALSGEGVTIQRVHCDSNTDVNCKSTEHTRMLTGYIQAMGYQFLVKPDAWATLVADRHSRSRVHKKADFSA